MCERAARRELHPDVCHCVWHRRHSEPLNLCPTRYQALMFISERLGQGVSCRHLVRRPVEPKPKTPSTSRPCTPSNSVISNQLPWKQHHNNIRSNITRGMPEPHMRRAHTMTDIFHYDGHHDSHGDGHHDGCYDGCHGGRHDVAAAIAFQEQLLLERLNLHTRLLEGRSVPNLRAPRSFTGPKSSTGCRPEVHWDDAGVGTSGVSGGGEESVIWLPQMYQRQESAGDATSEVSREQHTVTSTAPTVTVEEEVDSTAGVETCKQPECSGSGQCVDEADSPMPPHQAEAQLMTHTDRALPAKAVRPPAMTTPIKKPMKASVIMSYDIRADNIPAWRRAAEKRIHLPKPRATGGHQPSSVNVSTAVQPPPTGLSRAPSFTFGQLDQASRRLSRLVSGTASSFQSLTEYCHRMVTPTSGKSAGYRKRGTYSSADDIGNPAVEDQDSFQDGYDDEDMLCEDISALPFPPSPTPKYKRKAPYTSNISSSSGIIEYTKSEKSNTQCTSPLAKNSKSRHPTNQRPVHDATCIVGHQQTSVRKPHTLQYGGIGFRSHAQKLNAGSPGNRAASISGKGIPSSLEYSKRADVTGERPDVKTRTIIDIRLGDLGRISAGSRASESDVTSQASTARRFCSLSRSSLRSAFR